MRLTNPFVGYVTRSFTQIVRDSITKFQVLVPEVTDHTDTNPWVKAIRIWASIMEMVGYYVDTNAREAYLETAVIESSGIKIAKQFDYRVKGTLAASVDVKFFIDTPAASDITIPINTRISTADGVEFLTSNQGIIATGDTEVTVAATQRVAVNAVSLGTSDGSANQMYTLEQNVVDNNIVADVDGTTFEPVETFAYSLATNNHFVAAQNEEKVIRLEFGDGINGAIPAAGKEIIVDYFVSQGELGNVGIGAINQVITTVTVPVGVILKVTNDLAASGGADAEDLQDLKKRIPLSLRTLLRAVTDQDYIDIASLAPGVGQAGLIYDCGKFVDLYVVPEGGGIASTQLRSDTESFFDDKRMVTTRVRVFSAGEVLIQITANIRVLPNFVRSVVLQEAQQNMLDFLSSDNQEVGGSLELGNLYAVLENTTGVDVSRITRILPIPFPRPTQGDVPLNASIAIQEGSASNINWEIRLITSTKYELYKEGQFVGSFDISQEVVLPEVIITVNPNTSYVIGHAWVFVTYPFNDDITLAEPSVPITRIDLLNFTATGGLQ